METGSALQKEEENKKSKIVDSMEISEEVNEEQKETWNEMDNLESVQED